AVNPLYLHGTGVLPGGTPSTMDPNIGTQATACAVQPAAGGVISTFAFANLPAQTVTGVWSFTMFWSGGTGLTNDTVTLTVGLSTSATCSPFVPAFNWSTTYGAAGVNTTSPFTANSP